MNFHREGPTAACDKRRAGFAGGLRHCLPHFDPAPLRRLSWRACQAIGPGLRCVDTPPSASAVIRHMAVADEAEHRTPCCGIASQVTCPSRLFKQAGLSSCCRQTAFEERPDTRASMTISPTSPRVFPGDRRASTTNSKRFLCQSCKRVCPNPQAHSTLKHFFSAYSGRAWRNWLRRADCIHARLVKISRQASFAMLHPS